MLIFFGTSGNIWFSPTVAHPCSFVHREHPSSHYGGQQSSLSKVPHVTLSFDEIRWWDMGTHRGPRAEGPLPG